MVAAASISSNLSNLADLLEQFADYPPARIRLKPVPGTATVLDVEEIERSEGRLCELIDGVLVEKTVGLKESVIAGYIARKIGNFAEEHDLGEVAGAGWNLTDFARSSANT